jgi:hypothetical protein
VIKAAFYFAVKAGIKRNLKILAGKIAGRRLPNTSGLWDLIEKYIITI